MLNILFNASKNIN